MCISVKSALDVIKSQNGKKPLTRKEQIMLFEKVIEDQAKLGADVKELKTDMQDVKSNVKLIKEMLEQRKRTFWDEIPLLKDVPTFFWITIIFFIGCVFAWLGANMSWVQNVFKFGGQ